MAGLGQTPGDCHAPVPGPLKDYFLRAAMAFSAEPTRSAPIWPFHFSYTGRVAFTNASRSAADSCVTVTPSVQVLQAKETAYLDVTMDARRFTGPKTVSIYVTVGPQYVSTATLQVTAHSRADVVFNPGEVNFGVVSAGQTPTSA